MKLPKAAWVCLGVLFALASLAIHYEVKIGLHRQSTGSTRVMGNITIGQSAPDFSLLDLSNQTVTLSSFRGKKVILMDFWATWCGPCRMAMPGLQALQDKFKDRGLEILSLNQREDADHVRNFIQQKKYSFHVLLDQDGAIGGLYGVQGIPTLVLVDKQGVVQWMSVGYSDNDDELGKQVDRFTFK